MRRVGLTALAALAVLIGGCATPYKPIQLDASFWQDKRGTIGVAQEKMPEANAHMMGAQGLLDIAINKSNAGPMVEQLKKLDVKRAASIPANLADGLTRRGFRVTRLDTIDLETLPEFKPEANPELYAPRDFKGLKGKGVDKLLLVTIEKIGTVRPYYGFIPTGVPRAVFAVRGQLIDLETNKLLWYNRVETTAAIADPWDQEPNFPNVSAAVLKNLSETAPQFERSLFSSGEASTK